MNRLWVVEMADEATGRWEPTVGVALTRAEGRQKLARWRERNVGGFRLRRYRPVLLPCDYQRATRNVLGKDASR